MSSLDQFQAFVTAAELGSFSAASRKLSKAQSAVSTAIINLEIEVGTQLFDRTGRYPQLTKTGSALLEHAKSVLKSKDDFQTHANAFYEGVETQLCIAIEHGVFDKSLRAVFKQLANIYPSVEIELLAPGPNDVAGLLKDGHVDVGLMMEQETYPQGFHFKGVGYSRLIPVCGSMHSLASLKQISHANLRQHRQLITRSRHQENAVFLRDQRSPNVWYGESSYTIMELLMAGIGWAVLPQTVVSKALRNGELAKLDYSFQQSDILQGIDVVWTQRRALGKAGQWILDQFLNLNSELWSG
jgi:DNA-binding transcriptional LysR family regulator